MIFGVTGLTGIEQTLIAVALCATAFVFFFAGVFFSILIGWWHDRKQPEAEEISEEDRKELLESVARRLAKRILEERGSRLDDEE